MDVKPVQFYVAGMPAPQGSKIRFPNGGMKESSPNVKPWREAVKAAFLDAYPQWPPVIGPLAVKITFWLPRPGSHFGTGRNMDRLRASAPAWPAKKPDLDKTIRSTLDALSGLLWVDDSQVVCLNSRKLWGRPGAIVEVLPLGMYAGAAGEWVRR